MEIKEIASSEEEDYTNEETRHLQINKKEVNTNNDEPVILELPDTFTDKDWGMIDLIDK